MSANPELDALINQKLDELLPQKLEALLREREEAKTPSMTIIATKGTLDWGYPLYRLRLSGHAFATQAAFRMA